MRRMSTVTALIFLVTLLTCGFSASGAETLKIGFNIPLTGDIPQIGESSRYAAEILKTEVNGTGGIKVGDKTYALEFVYEDNESKAESATATALN